MVPYVDPRITQYQAGLALGLERARQDRITFIEYVMLDEQGRHIKTAPFHREWAELIPPYGIPGKVQILAPRDHAKCVADMTLITLADSSRVEAEKLPEHFEILAWDEAQGWSKQPARKFANQVQPIIRVTTHLGKSIEVSPEHPFWTSRGWKAAADLKAGEAVAISRGLPAGTETVGLEKAWLLGVLIGDGGLSGAQPQITIAEPQLLAQIQRVVATLGWKLTNKTPVRPGIDWSISGDGLRDWLRELGLYGSNSHTKRIPAVCFTWTEADIAALVAGYLETDGTTRDHATWGRMVEIASVNHDLLADVQSLLLRLSVVTRLSRINAHYKGEPYISWKLNVCGSSISRLAELMPLWGPKAKKLHAYRMRSDGDRLDLIPDKVIERLGPVTRVRKERGKIVVCKDKRNRPNGWMRKVVLSKTEAGGTLYHNAQLAWDKIESVEKLTAQRTWSIESGNHTLVTDDFITHNTTTVMGFVLWELGRNHNLRVKYVTADEDLAVNIAISLQSYIMNSTALHEVFPDLLPDKDSGWSHGKLFIQRDAMSKDPSLEVSTILSTGIGAHCDLLIFDDVVSFRNAIAQPKMREQVKRIFKEVWLNLLDEITGRAIYLATPWHEDDLTEDLRHNQDWLHWARPAIDDHTGTALWPSRWPLAALKRRKRLLTPTIFARQFLLRAVSEEDKTFPTETLERIKIIASEIPPETRYWLKVGGVDLAHSLRKSGKRSVIVTLAMDPLNGVCIVVAVRMGKWRFPTLISNTISEYHTWRWVLVNVENNAMQQAMVEQLPMEDATIPVAGFTTGMNKLHPEYGLPGMASVMEHLGLLIPFYPDHEPDCQCGFCELHRELASHPVGEYSDGVMALWFAYEGAKSLMAGGLGGNLAEISEDNPAGFLLEKF